MQSLDIGTIGTKTGPRQWDVFPQNARLYLLLEMTPAMLLKNKMNGANGRRRLDVEKLKNETWQLTTRYVVDHDANFITKAIWKVCWA